MSWGRPVRITLFAIVGTVFVGSLIGIMLTGPVVVRVPRLKLDGLGISPERLRADVERLCFEFTPRSYRHTENLDRAAQWIAAELRATGLEVELQEYRLAEGIYRNVVARRPSQYPTEGVVVVGAHYDAYQSFPGANDNASGVAVLLELARTLPDVPPRRDQYFVLFSTEEPPLFDTESMGSFVFADRLRRAGREVLWMAALDLVGYFSEEPHSQRFPLPGLGLLYPHRGDFIAVVGDLGAGRSIDRIKRGMMATEALPVHSFRAPSRLAPVLGSDHVSFRRLGFPGVQITDTAFMRYPHYHTADDTPEKLDYARMAQVVEALHGALWEGVPERD